MLGIVSPVLGAVPGWYVPKVDAGVEDEAGANPGMDPTASDGVIAVEGPGTVLGAGTRAVGVCRRRLAVIHRRDRGHGEIQRQPGHADQRGRPCAANGIGPSV